MFDPRSDYALNKLNPDAIVCKSVTGAPIRITRADFASEEEFLKWKTFSDQDYHSIEAGSREDDNCFSLNEQLDAVAPSAEEMLLTKASAKSKTASAWSQKIRFSMTTVQARRLRMLLNEKLSVTEIASNEGVSKASVSRSLSAAKRKIAAICKQSMNDR